MRMNGSPVMMAVSFLLVATQAAPALARTRLAQAPEPRARGNEDGAGQVWSSAYAEARAAMLAGDFAAAAAKFSLLVASAPDPGSRILAAEMTAACRTWAEGGFVLTQPHRTDLAAPVLLPDRRTTDEISILYTNAVLFGLYGGVVMDVWTEPSSPGSAILPPLLFGGLSAGTVALLDKSTNLRYGVAQSIVSGLYIGIEEALGWTLWHEARVPYSDEWGEKTVTTLILGMGTVGAVAGGIVGSYLGTTPGRASLMGSAAMWSGLVAGTIVGGLTDSDDVGLLSASVLLNVGAVAGVLAGARVSPSIARVRFIDLGGLSGALLAGGLYWTFRDKDAGPRGVITATGLGMVAGLATSWFLTGDMETDQPRKQKDLGIAQRLLPTVAPTANGPGLVVGVAAAI